MSGSTSELNLKTAVDADDTADYLTLSLADSLRTVDALFNNTSGHNHGGAHQGGPLSVSTGQIADGSITTAKILDGTIQGGDIADGAITSAKIADGTITTADIALNSVQYRLGQYGANTTFSTTGVAGWIPTPISVTFTCTGRPLRVEGMTSLVNSTAGGSASVGLALDGSVQLIVCRVAAGVAGAISPVTWVVYVQPPAGSHTIALHLENVGAGNTLSILGTMTSTMFITEELR